MKKSSLLLPALLLLVSLPCAAQAEPVASGDVPESDADCYNFRLQAVEWDYGGAIGVQWSLAYHQYIDSNGIVLTPDDPAGSWVPFIPGPTIRGEVGDIICVKIQNRIDVSGGQFIEHLMDDMVVHWHGMELANAYDGTPVTQAPIEPGTDYIYRFRLVRPGLYWYHPHWDSMIQNPLGANGALIVDDAVSLTLRDAKVIPHEDRTFVLTLSDLSFQDERGEASGGNYVPFADIASHVGPVYIRNIMAIGSGNMNQNFGDAILVNGVHGYPFNHPLGNSQQFWHEGHRTNAAPTVLKANESVAFHVTNNGMHRFYKIHLAYKTSSSGNWQHSGALYRLGGEGGLLNEARQPNGIFNDGIHGVSTNGTVVGWRLRGIQKRDGSDDGEVDDPAGEGLQAVQESTEMLTGEFLLPTSSRVMVAFRVDPSWVEVALRANGFSVINKKRSEPMKAAGLYWEDEAPEDLEIAIFDVEGMASGGDPYVLTAPI
ncbi:MAG: multicopper oxidase domain-containing protein [Kiritimatiellae bacterium]|nr:multicopper oxidase domain-containing protein [Kiritimatiellia bacterium]